MLMKYSWCIWYKTIYLIGVLLSKNNISWGSISIMKLSYFLQCQILSRSFYQYQFLYNRATVICLWCNDSAAFYGTKEVRWHIQFLQIVKLRIIYACMNILICITEIPITYNVLTFHCSYFPQKLINNYKPFAISH